MLQPWSVWASIPSHWNISLMMTNKSLHFISRFMKISGVKKQSTFTELWWTSLLQYYTFYCKEKAVEHIRSMILIVFEGMKTQLLTLCVLLPNWPEQKQQAETSVPAFTVTVRRRNPATWVTHSHDACVMMRRVVWVTAGGRRRFLLTHLYTIDLFDSSTSFILCFDF